jgi:dipeptidyl-peptidase-3
MLKKALVIMSIVASAACGRAPSDSLAPAVPAATADRKYLLERVDDAAVVQMYADGFTGLSLKEKTLVWHLYQAALAGRDIFYDQRYAHNLEMRDLLEAVLTHKAGIDPATFAEIERYTKLFWINTGPFNNLTARKFVLACTPGAFAAAVKAAAGAGAQLPLKGGETVDQLLARLQPMFFDPNVDAMVTNKTPPKGQDILASSANNLYVGLTMRDLVGTWRPTRSIRAWSSRAGRSSKRCTA